MLPEPLLRITSEVLYRLSYGGSRRESLSQVYTGLDKTPCSIPADYTAYLKTCPDVNFSSLVRLWWHTSQNHL